MATADEVVLRLDAKTSDYFQALLKARKGHKAG